MRTLKTRICLPPGPLPVPLLRELLRRVFVDYQWFQPMRYGFVGLDERLDDPGDVYSPLLAYYDEWKAFTVAARTNRDCLLLTTTKHDDPPHAGALTWVTATSEARKFSWRERHLRQVAELMRHVGSPLAFACTAESLSHKQSRLVPSANGPGQEEVFTVRDPSEGLAGLFWRNFYGPPFTRLFGERLAALPEDARRDLGDGLTLVQPYELPTQAGTPEADSREREFISLLGPECFYDFEHHLKPTRTPTLHPVASP